MTVTLRRRSQRATTRTACSASGSTATGPCGPSPLQRSPLELLGGARCPSVRRSWPGRDASAGPRVWPSRLAVRASPSGGSVAVLRARNATSRTGSPHQSRCAWARPRTPASTNYGLPSGKPAMIPQLPQPLEERGRRSGYLHPRLDRDPGVTGPVPLSRPSWPPGSPQMGHSVRPLIDDTTPPAVWPRSILHPTLMRHARQRSETTNQANARPPKPTTSKPSCMLLSSSGRAFEAQITRPIETSEAPSNDSDSQIFHHWPVRRIQLVMVEYLRFVRLPRLLPTTRRLHRHRFDWAALRKPPPTTSAAAGSNDRSLARDRPRRRFDQPTPRLAAGIAAGGDERGTGGA
jgi:hypothetical protein